MNDSKESLEEKKKRYTKLLQDYEPVLRFSAGENFFPMNVADYGCMAVNLP